MSVSQRKAVITLIHKGKELPKDELTSYRPISLTETDYKILAKCLANRLSKVITDLINEDQAGFIKGRKSSTIIRLIDDVIDYMNNENKPGIILALDYSRAFDSISKDFIIWSFKKFGFGNNFTNWVKVINANTESCINYNGWISETFAVETGIRQGCPLSPMTFVLALELLAIHIREDRSIKGIKLPQYSTEINEALHLIKLAMYADDITMFLRDHRDLENAIKTVNQFSELSQLRMNVNKTEAMWLGSMKHSQETYCNLKWKNQLKILGILFQNNTTASNIQQNWEKRINKINQIIIQWYKRNLSITGKLCIIKSLLISQLVYPMQALTAPSHFLTKINTMLFRFLWKKKYSNTKAYEKVKRIVVCNKLTEGGINMINIVDMQTSFLLPWMAQLQDDGFKRWKCIPRKQINQMGDKLTAMNASVSSATVKGLKYVYSPFWQKALASWIDYKKLFESKDRDFEHQPLWNNKQIVYRHKHLFIKRWIDANLNTIRDVWQNGDCISIETIREKTGNYPSIHFDYNAACTAIHAFVRRHTEHPVEQIQTIRSPLANMTAKMFRSLITKDKTVSPCSTFFWRNRYNYVIDKNNWLCAYASTNEERLRLLQWKILHNIYPTNILLQKIKIRDNNHCELCDEIDYIEHFFWQCKKLKPFWNNVESTILRKTGIQVKLSETAVLLGYETHKLKLEVNKIINHILLIAKMTISKYRYGDRFNIDATFEKEMLLRLKN